MDSADGAANLKRIALESQLASLSHSTYESLFQNLRVNMDVKFTLPKNMKLVDQVSALTNIRNELNVAIANTNSNLDIVMLNEPKTLEVKVGYDTTINCHHEPGSGIYVISRTLNDEAQMPFQTCIEKIVKDQGVKAATSN